MKTPRRSPHITIKVCAVTPDHDTRAIVRVGADWKDFPAGATELAIALKALRVERFVLERMQSRLHQGEKMPSVSDMLGVSQVESPVRAHGLELEDVIIIGPDGKRYSFRKHGQL